MWDHFLDREGADRTLTFQTSKKFEGLDFECAIAPLYDNLTVQQLEGILGEKDMK
jgi:hypothetical protein